MRLLVSLFMWTAWLVAGLVGIPLLILYMALFPRRKAYALIRRTVTAMLGLSGIRVVQEGVEKLDVNLPYILMANHVNLLDPFFYAVVTPAPYSGMEKKENFKIPFYGWLMRTWGNVAIDRTDLEQAKRDLERGAAFMREEGIWLIVMPEGTRSRDGYVAPFKKGGFHLSLQTGIPIVPVTLNGAAEIQRRGSFWARPGTVELLFGDPIDPARYDVAHLDRFMADVRTAILRPFTGPKSEADLVGVSPVMTTRSS